MTSSLKSVSEVTAKLGDKGFAQQYVVQVNKGTADRPRNLDVIEWHTAVRMLDEVFGPFGWSAEIVNSHSDYANGIFLVDMTLTGRAVDDESGEVIEIKRPGRGLGLCPRSSGNADPEVDRQAHGAKSDAITNATKALGDGFGLYLYQKKPQQAAGYGNGNGRTDTRAQYSNGGGNGGNLGPRPSPKQLGVLTKNGYPEEQVATLEFKQWKGIVDAIFGGTTPEIAPAAETVSAGSRRPQTTTPAQEPDDIPF